MIELCNYIYNNYPNLKQQVPRWKLLSLLDRNEDKVVYVRENGGFKGAGLYVRISDEQLNELKLLITVNQVKEAMSDPNFIWELLNSKGNNIHFLYVLADSTRTILKGLKEAIRKENPKTVSWFNPKMTDLMVFERSL